MITLSLVYFYFSLSSTPTADEFHTKRRNISNFQDASSFRNYVFGYKHSVAARLEISDE